MTANWYEIDPTVGLTSSGDYVSFARRFLAENTALARDAAVCYAKRAVCREIDAFMLSNHLSAFLGCKYPPKIDMVSEVGLSVPDVVRDFVINPRNDIEHKYIIPDAVQAKHAVEIAELFMSLIAKEQERRAILSIACSISVSRRRSCKPGNEYDHLEFTLQKQNKPMLLIEQGSEDSLVMVIHPSDMEVTACPLRKFTRDQAIALAKLLRQHYVLAQQGSSTRTLVDCAWLAKLKTQLRLPSVC
jgi:hypothetical protein